MSNYVIKVGFPVDDDDVIWNAYDIKELRLPYGWELVETDCSGARCIAIFDVSDVPTKADCDAVELALAELDADMTL